MTLRQTMLCLIAPALLGAGLPLEKIRVPPDGALPVSDDKADVVYRISYRGASGRGR